MQNNQSRSEQIVEKFEKALPNIWKKARKETEPLIKREVELFGMERTLQTGK